MTEIEREPKEKKLYLPETEVMLEQLRKDPATAFYCVHGDGDGAIGIYEVPKGCVALPGVETQPLCQHHRWSNGSFEGMNPIVDLTIDGAWSEQFEEEPDFCIIRDIDSDNLKLVDFLTRGEQ